MSKESMKLEKIMEQAQVFASAWSLVGGRFDNGNMLDEAEVAKNELHQMIAEALAEQPAQKEPDNSDDLTIAYMSGVQRGKELALAEQPAQQEPVGEVEQIEIDDDGQASAWFKLHNNVELGQLLYTSPPQRKPLTDEQINRVWMLNGGGLAANRYHDFVRAIEAAHGIKENT